MNPISFPFFEDRTFHQKRFNLISKNFCRHFFGTQDPRDPRPMLWNQYVRTSLFSILWTVRLAQQGTLSPKHEPNWTSQLAYTVRQKVWWYPDGLIQVQRCPKTSWDFVPAFFRYYCVKRISRVFWVPSNIFKK